MAKCAICGNKKEGWTWQPFGPEEGLNCFTAPGHHYRGFPALHCCDECKQAIQRGDPASFKYQGIWFDLAGGVIYRRRGLVDAAFK